MTHKDPTHDVATRRSSPEVQQRKADVVRLKREGFTFRQIGTELRIDYSYAHDLYWQAMADIPSPAVSAMRAHITEMMQDTYEVVRAIRDGTHYAHSGAELIYPPHEPGVGEKPPPLRDPAPVLHASRELRKIADTLARLHGANAPTQVSIGGEIRFEVAGVDMDALT